MSMEKEFKKQELKSLGYSNCDFQKKKKFSGSW